MVILGIKFVGFFYAVYLQIHLLAVPDFLAFLAVGVLFDVPKTLTCPGDS